MGSSVSKGRGDDARAHRYNVNFDDGSDSTFNEYAPFARFFVVKAEDGGAPVSLSANAQLFVDDYPAAGGLHFTTATGRPLTWRATLLEQSFRRETYRGLRLAGIRRF